MNKNFCQKESAQTLVDCEPPNWGVLMNDLYAASPPELKHLVFNLGLACDQSLSFLHKRVRELESEINTPEAPANGKVVVREAEVRLAIRELNHARKGVDPTGRANYVHRLLLAMLDEEPIKHVADEKIYPYLASLADHDFCSLLRQCLPAIESWEREGEQRWVDLHGVYHLKVGPNKYSDLRQRVESKLAQYCEKEES